MQILNMISRKRSKTLATWVYSIFDESYSLLRTDLMLATSSDRFFRTPKRCGLGLKCSSFDNWLMPMSSVCSCDLDLSGSRNPSGEQLSSLQVLFEWQLFRNVFDKHIVIFCNQTGIGLFGLLWCNNNTRTAEMIDILPITRVQRMYTAENKIKIKVKG